MPPRRIGFLDEKNTIEFSEDFKMTEDELLESKLEKPSECLVREKNQYAEYMLRQIEALDWPALDIAQDVLPQLQMYWMGAGAVDLEGIRDHLWEWVDTHGGPRPTGDKNMILVRMLICLAYEDNRELEGMSFFEDLMAKYHSITAS
ncbi:MAG: hypothetical protein RL260_2389 [Pseudomonadota bacterium]|jgi:hypothetical protein